jgi:hypothetical protein
LTERDSSTIFLTSDFFPMNRLDSTAENAPKIAELKLSSCRLEVADFRKNYDCGVVVVEQHFIKSCKIEIAEVLPSSYRIAIADSKKKLRVPTSAERDCPARFKRGQSGINR